MPRRLTRDTRNAILGGVAAGIADYFDLDPVLVRIGFILLALLHGVGLIVYLVCWVIMPRREAAIAPPAVPAAAPTPGGGTEEAGTAHSASPAAGDAAGAARQEPPADRFVGDVRQAGERIVEDLRGPAERSGRGRIVAGTILIGIGLLFLAERFTWFYWPFWFHFWDLWPLIVIGVGVAMMAGALRGKAT